MYHLTTLLLIIGFVFLPMFLCMALYEYTPIGKTIDKILDNMED